MSFLGRCQAPIFYTIQAQDTVDPLLDLWHFRENPIQSLRYGEESATHDILDNQQFNKERTHVGEAYPYALSFQLICCDYIQSLLQFLVPDVENTSDRSLSWACMTSLGTFRELTTGLRDLLAAIHTRLLRNDIGIPGNHGSARTLVQQITEVIWSTQ